MFDNRMLRRTTGHKTDEVTGDWNKVQKGASSFVFFTKYY
jgi:hypothetical protein